MAGERVEAVEEEKDLGVWISSTMKPSKQCAAAAKSANFALGQIQRAFHYRKKINLIPLYKCFVRPRLEFAVAAWNPWMEGDIQALEKVQQRLIRMISDVRGTTYTEKLEDAGLTTLVERRRRGDLLETFKTLKGVNRVEKEAWFEVVGSDARSTRSTTMVGAEGETRRELVLKVERSRLEIRRNFFSVRAAREWNELPDAVKEAKSVNSFKNAYDEWRKTNQTPETANRAPTERICDDITSSHRSGTDRSEIECQERQ